MVRRTPTSTLFPYTTLFRSGSSIVWRGPTPPERARPPCGFAPSRSEEHTSELQSRGHLVCRLLLEKKKKIVEQGLRNLIEHTDTLKAKAAVSRKHDEQDEVTVRIGLGHLRTGGRYVWTRRWVARME